MKAFLRTHALGIALAILFGIAVAVPQLVAIERMGDSYEGMRPLIGEDEVYYLARAQETLDGHETLGNPYLYEHKEEPGVQIWMADAALAHASHALFGNLADGGVFLDFLLPALGFLAAYGILYLLVPNALLAASTASLLFGLFYFNWNRAPNPQLMLVLLFAVLALIKGLSGGKRGWYVLAAVLGGTLFYIYPFWWTTWVVLLAIAIVACFLFVRTAKAHLPLLLVLIGSIFIGSPYLLDSAQAASLPHYAESLSRIGFIATHIPSGIVPVAIASVTLLLFAWSWYRRLIPQTSVSLLAASGVLAGAVVMNQHVITGSNFQFLIHYQMIASFLSVFALYLLLAPILARGNVRRTGAAVCLVIVALLFGGPKILSAATPRANDIEAQRYGPVLSWLAENTETDDVVYADPKLSPYIPAYTEDNVFFSTYVFATFIPSEEVEDRYLRAYYFDKPSRERIEETVYDAVGASYIGTYQHERMADKIRALLGMKPMAPATVYPPELIDSFLARAEALQQLPFSDAMGKYRIDYLVWDSVLHPDWKIPSDLVKAYEANGLVVYAVRKP